MADKVSMKLEGLDKALEALSGRNVGVAKREVKKRAYGIARTTREKLRAAAPVGATKNLRKSHKAKTTRGGGAEVFVDRSGGPSGKGYHIHIVTEGTVQRRTKRGANRGSMPADDYVSPIIDAAQDQVRTELAPEVLAEIVKNVRSNL